MASFKYKDLDGNWKTIVSGGGSGGNARILEYTTAEYEALSQEEKENIDDFVVITDAEDIIPAEAIVYDNTESGLESITIQDAIDELARSFHDSYDELVADVVDNLGTQVIMELSGTTLTITTK